MKCMKNERLVTYQEKKKLKKSWKITKEEVWSERDGVWEMNRCGQIKRDRRNENQIAKKWIYRPSVKLDKCRYRKVSREVSRKRLTIAKVSREVSRKRSSIVKVSSRYRGTTHQIQEQKLDRSTRCREAIEAVGAFLIYPLGIEKLSGKR